MSRKIRSNSPAGLAVLLATASACLVTVTPDAFAQTSEPAADSGNDITLDEILVTARKREESLQEVPLSATVFGTANLDARSVTDVKDLLRLVPNVSSPDLTGSSASTDVVIRGISTNTRNVGFESGVGVYIDGVYQGRQMATNQELVGIQQVEILRGPQGTVFGKNNVAGAINIVTRQPSSDNVDYGASFQYGRFNDILAKGLVNLPLFDSGAILVSGFRHISDGYVLNVNTGNKLANDDAYGGRISGRFEPSSRFTLTLAADYRNDDNRSSFPEVIGGGLNPNIANIVPGIHTLSLTEDPFVKRNLWGVSGTAEYAFDSGHTLTSITAYRNNYVRVRNDNDNDALDIFLADFRDWEDHFSQELRLSSPTGGRFNYLVGLWYLNQTAKQARFTYLGNPSTDTAQVTGQVKSESFAVFADAQYKLTDALTLGAGIRFTHERKVLSDYTQRTTGALVPAFPTFTAPVEGSRSSDDISPVITLSYKLAPEVNAYLRYARGFKSGGWNIDFAQGVAPASADKIEFNDEALDSYEAGLKTSLFDGKLRWNLAAFYSNYDKQQVQQLVGLAFLINNAGTSRIYGLESDLALRLTPTLTLSSGLGYNNAEYKSFVNCGVAADCSGNRLINAPKWSGTVAVDWSHEIDTWKLGAHADLAYRGSWEGNAQNATALHTRATHRTNASVDFGPASGKWQLSFYVDNLFNNVLPQGRIVDPFVDPGTIVEAYAPPRTWGFRLSLGAL